MSFEITINLYDNINELYDYMTVELSQDLIDLPHDELLETINSYIKNAQTALAAEYPDATEELHFTAGLDCLGLNGNYTLDQVFNAYCNIINLQYATGHKVPADILYNAASYYNYDLLAQVYNSSLIYLINKNYLGTTTTRAEREELYQKYKDKGYTRENQIIGEIEKHYYNFDGYFFKRKTRLKQSKVNQFIKEQSR